MTNHACHDTTNSMMAGVCPLVACVPMLIAGAGRWLVSSTNGMMAGAGDDAIAYACHNATNSMMAGASDWWCYCLSW